MIAKDFHPQTPKSLHLRKGILSVQAL
jgi:hypothetical protein